MDHLAKPRITGDAKFSGIDTLEAQVSTGVRTLQQLNDSVTQYCPYQLMWCYVAQDIRDYAKSFVSLPVNSSVHADRYSQSNPRPIRVPVPCLLV